MTRGISSLAALLLLASVLAGCGDDSGSDASDDTSSVEETPTSSEPTEGDDDGPQLVLENAGAEPRVDLKVMPAEGASQHATMTTTMSMQATVDGERQPSAPAYPISMGMLIEVTDVADDGSVTARFEYDEIKVLGKGAYARQLEQSMAPLAGVEGTITTSPTGEPLESELDIPSGMDPAMSSTLEGFEDQLANLSPPLPDEPVGVGAEWTVTTSLEMNGLETENIYTYKVVELRGDTLVLDMSYEQSAEPQEVDAPGLPAGATLNLDSMEVSGQGQVTVELGLLLPLESSADGGGAIRMTGEGDGSEFEIVQEMHIKMELESD